MIAGGLAVRALYLWFRPHLHRVRQSGLRTLRVVAKEMVREEGRDWLSTSRFAHDKSWFFSPSGRSFLALRSSAVSRSSAASRSGSPKKCLLSSRLPARSARRGWRVAVIGVSADALDFYRGLGLRPLYIGDEAIVRPLSVLARRSPDPQGAPVRGAAPQSRLSVARWGRPSRRCAALPARAVSAMARARAGARLLDGDGRALRLPGRRDHPRRREHGKVGGFLQLVPSPATSGYSLASMRRRLDTPNGLMEFLIVEALEWGERTRSPSSR